LEETEKKDKDFFESIWKFFASVKFAIYIFISLALLSIVGTIVEQQAEPARNIELLAKFFGDAVAPTVYNIFANLGFMDMYGSWWYVGLLGLFSINLIVCSIDRLPKTWRLVRTPMRPVSENVIKSKPIKKELSINAGIGRVKDEFFNALTASKYKVLNSEKEGSVQLYTQKGKYARLSVYVVHLSIIIIFLGAVIGMKFGFKAYVNLPEGRTTNVVYKSPKESIPLDFTVKCNWYKTLYYENGDTPKEFQSELVIYENGKEVRKKVIEVNDPLKYRGITFYQSSYGFMKEAQGVFVLNITPKGGQEQALRLRFGDSFEIPGTEVRGTIVDFSQALGRDRTTGALTTYADNMVNPAVGINFYEPGKKVYKGWILNRFPETGMLQNGHTIKFEDYWGVEFTGLQVAKDPGVWLIYLASIIMTLALYICFFMSHRKIWVNITPSGSGKKSSVIISVGGSTNRNQLAFEKEIDRLVSGASQAIEGRSKK
jgi:cytochrome c biogenesis protein